MAFIIVLLIGYQILRKAFQVHVMREDLLMQPDDVQKKICSVIEQVETLLTPVELLSLNESRHIIGRWVAIFEGNFQCWLASCMLAARSLQGRRIAQDNLSIEVKENHASMLRNFAIAAKAEPDLTDFHAVYEAVERIRKIIAELSGLKSLALLAIHESETISYAYLAALARKVGSNDFTYTDVHEVEDIEHALQFQKALLAELQFDYSEPEQNIDEVTEALMNLYRSIFEITGYSQEQ